MQNLVSCPSHSQKLNWLDKLTTDFEKDNWWKEYANNKKSGSIYAEARTNLSKKAIFQGKTIFKLFWKYSLRVQKAILEVFSSNREFYFARNWSGSKKASKQY